MKQGILLAITVSLLLLTVAIAAETKPAATTPTAAATSTAAAPAKTTTTSAAPAVTSKWGSPKDDRATIIEKTMTPYTGPSVFGPPQQSTATNSFGPLVVDPSTMTGKVMAGYQGWHLTDTDGAGRGWNHYEARTGHRFEPGFCRIDLWPDVSELDPDERYATPFRKADGSVAEVYSAFNEKTVLRHFKWMRDYGIDGVFLQRFVGETMGTTNLRHVNVVLQHCRLGANTYGRTYGVMYDLTGLRTGQMPRVMDDWKLLVDKMQITRDKAYIHHAGKPVVVVWGIGFSDNRPYTLAECADFVKFLKDDPKYGGNTVMIGVPTYWRTLGSDTVKDPALTDVILKADIISPWTVGRYSTPAAARNYAEKELTPDLAWCREHKKEYMPVVFPGFSWHNLFPNSKQNQIPRLGGEFLWAQYAAAKKAGATMVYESMFDEIDEGTAIYKVTNDPPVGASSFVTYEGLPSDYYLREVGTATRMIRGDMPLTEKMPNLIPAK
jgi:hypothetical protein